MGESVGRPVMHVGVTTKRWPRHPRGAELALGIVARGLVPFVAHRAEVRVVNVAVQEIAQTRSMDGHGEKLQPVAPHIAADTRPWTVRVSSGSLGRMTDAARAWLAEWNSQTLTELTSRFQSLGADEPEGWASSELGENFPQTARFLFLRALWRRLEEQLEEVDGAVNRVLVAGGSRQDIRRALASSLYSVAFDFAYLLDEPDGRGHSTEPYTDVAEDEPRWVLMEASPDGDVTGRVVGGLHESLLEMAPGGEEAASEAGWF